MPTDAPFKDLLDPDRAKVEARELIDASCPLLREMVNYATYVFVRCTRAPDDGKRGDENEDVACIVLYQQLIELMDSAEVLFSQSCCVGAIPLLRSAFEATLSLEYILVSDAHYVIRSLAWTCNYLHRRMEKHENIDRNTPRGETRIRVMEEFFQKKGPDYDSTKRVAALQSVLARQQFKDLEADRAARIAKSRSHRPPEWFSLLGGPSDRRQLARFLNHEPEYLTLYGEWSDVAHATDAAVYVGPGSKKGEASFNAIRTAKELPQQAFLAATFLLRSTRLMLNHFRPNEPGLRVWYNRDVKPRYERLAHLRVEVV